MNLVKRLKLWNIKFSIWLYETAFKWGIVPDHEREATIIELQRWKTELEKVTNG